MKNPPKELVFSYKEFPKPGDTKRPVADVTFINGERIQPLICIIDSGADCCTLPISIGRIGLGIDFDKLRLRPHGVECACNRKPPMKGYYYKIEIDIRGYRFPVMVNWVESDTAPLIGREDVFSRFNVIFEGNRSVRFRRR